MWASNFPLVILLFSTSWLVEAGNIKKENSLAPPYIAQAENLMFWDLTGSAALGGTYIRLTTDEPEKQGAIWNNFPMLVNNWEFQLHFHIHGKGVNLNGDGLAVWYVKDILHKGPVFGSKDYFHGLGVFVDTFENKRDPSNKIHRYPYISAMVNNGSLHYDHHEDGAMTRIGGCHIPIRNLEVPTKMAVSYINQNLAIYLDYEGIGQWRVCFKTEGVHLPTGYFFGVSASTSDVTDNHDLITVTTLNLDPPYKEWIDRGDVIPHVEDIDIPGKYVKDASEEEHTKVQHKREAPQHEEEDEEEEDEDDADKHTKQHFHTRDEKLKFKGTAEKHFHDQKPKPKETFQKHVQDEKPKPKETFQEHVEDEKPKPKETAEKHIHDEKEKPKVEETDSSPPSTSLFIKLIYITGALIILIVGISIWRKYAERRRERMHKRLF